VFRQATRIETSEVRQHRRHGASFLTKGAFWISFSTNVEESEPVGGGIYCAAFLNAEPARLLGLQVRAEGDFLLFIYIFVWLMAFLALTTIWRMLLLVGTLIGLVIPSFMNLAAMHSVRVGGPTLG